MQRTNINQVATVLFLSMFRIILLLGLIFGYFYFRKNVYFENYTIVVIVYSSIYVFLYLTFFLYSLRNTVHLPEAKKDLEKRKKEQESILEQARFNKIFFAIGNVVLVIFIIFTGIIGYWGLFILTMLSCMLRFLINICDQCTLKTINDRLTVLSEFDEGDC